MSKDKVPFSRATLSVASQPRVQAVAQPVHFASEDDFSDQDEIHEFDVSNLIDQESQIDANDGASNSDSSGCFVVDDPQVEKKYFQLDRNAAGVQAKAENRAVVENSRLDISSSSFMGDDATDIFEKELNVPNSIVEQTTRMTLQMGCSQSAFSSIKKRSLTTYTAGFK